MPLVKANLVVMLTQNNRCFRIMKAYHNESVTKNLARLKSLSLSISTFTEFTSIGLRAIFQILACKVSMSEF